MSLSGDDSSYTTFHSEAASDIIGDFDELIELYVFSGSDDFHNECLQVLERLGDKVKDEQFFRIKIGGDSEEDFIEFLERLHIKSMEHITNGGVNHVVFGEELLAVLNKEGVEIV